MWELKLSEWASTSLILISSLLLISILYEVVKSLFNRKYMGSMNRKSRYDNVLKSIISVGERGTSEPIRTGYPIILY